MNLFACEIPGGNQSRRYLSLLEPGRHRHIPEEALVGYLISNERPVIHENIIYNPAFIDLFHKIIVLTTLQSRETASAAAMQETGFIYVRDQRADAATENDPEDIIGSFEVLNGSLQPLSYQPNPKYKIISAKGMFRIPGDFDHLLELAILRHTG
jgi:hypothetical protein